MLGQGEAGIWELREVRVSRKPYQEQSGDVNTAPRIQDTGIAWGNSTAVPNILF